MILKFNFPNQKLEVIAHIIDIDGKLLLQQRGIKVRDENGLYEEVGGKFEEKDINFKTAIIRELKEEIGNEANIEISDSIAIYHCYKNNINWIFLIYLVKYINGEIKIMKPDKCLGYHFFTYEEAMNSELVTKSCKYLIKSIKENI